MKKNNRKLELTYSEQEYKEALKTINIRKLRKRLESYIKVFLQDNFPELSQDHYNIPLVFNHRLKKICGSYYPKWTDEETGEEYEAFIELSTYIIKHYSLLGLEEEVFAILGHELVHYAFDLLGKEVADGSIKFEETLANLKLPTSPSNLGRVNGSRILTPIYFEKTTIEDGKEVHARVKDTDSLLAAHGYSPLKITLAY